MITQLASACRHLITLKPKPGCKLELRMERVIRYLQMLKTVYEQIEGKISPTTNTYLDFAHQRAITLFSSYIQSANITHILKLHPYAKSIGS